MALAVVRSNALILRETLKKEARICQQPDLLGEELMKLLSPWRG